MPHARITPACAGKRLICHRCCFSIQDHPRLRGEKDRGHPRHHAGVGSPPLARGKEIRRSGLAVIAGITPACAGKSYVCGFSYMVCWDHPRLRGEKEHDIVLKDYSQGSPPLARGKESSNATKNILCRITPACAGKSFPSDDGSLNY